MTSPYEELELEDGGGSEVGLSEGKPKQSTRKLRIAQAGLIGMIVLIAGIVTLALLLKTEKKGTNVVFMIRSADHIVTDSAAGATAYSCASRTNNNMVGIFPNGTACVTLLEAFQAKGYLTGLVVKSSLSHATPGAFSAHSIHRHYEEFIAEQQSTAKIDLMLGGGRVYYEQRADGRNLSAEMVEQGYHYVHSYSQLEAASSLPLLGLFAEVQLPYAMDRQSTADWETPSLAQMVEAALRILGAQESPFFLLVEASLIDWCQHTNDPACSAAEILEYDQAVEYLVNFTEEQSTVVVGTSDHETGGLSLGYQGNVLNYPPYQWLPEVLARATHTLDWIMQQVYSNPELLNASVLQYYGIQLTDQELAYVRASWATHDTAAYALGEVVSPYAWIGFSTHGHSGSDVNFYATGEELTWAAAPIAGNLHNTQLGQALIDQFELAPLIEGMREEWAAKVTSPPSPSGARAQQAKHEQAASYDERTNGRTE